MVHSQSPFWQHRPDVFTSLAQFITKNWKQVAIMLNIITTTEMTLILRSCPKWNKHKLLHAREQRRTKCQRPKMTNSNPQNESTYHFGQYIQLSNAVLESISIQSWANAYFVAVSPHTKGTMSFSQTSQPRQVVLLRVVLNLQWSPIYMNKFQPLSAYLCYFHKAKIHFN